MAPRSICAFLIWHAAVGTASAVCYKVWISSKCRSKANSNRGTVDRYSYPHFAPRTAIIIDIETLAFMDVDICRRGQSELREAFRRAEAMETPSKIATLP
jgi:hypothetical protein